MKYSIILVLLCLLSAQIYSQEDSNGILKIETSMVVVPVRVVDSAGRFIPNLKKEQFQIYEDGKLQEISSFNTDDAPFTVALLLDVSTSTKFKLSEIQKAATDFLEQLRPNDQALVFTFDNNLIKVYDGKTEPLEGLQQSIQLTQTGGATSLYDAVEQAALKHLANRPGKKAIILFTDGVDTSSRQSYENSIRIAQESNALIYSIQYNTFDDSQKINASLPSQSSLSGGARNLAPDMRNYERGTMYLKKLTNNSGGRYYFAGTSGDLSDAFRLIAEELSQQYSLSYYPQNEETDRKKRQVAVKVSAPGAKSVLRKTYILSSKIK